MSTHYERGKYAAPESYQAKITSAWLEHNQRFRPALQKWQDLIASTSFKHKKKGKWQKIVAAHKITSETTDYILLSMSSFMQYLTEYCTFYTVKKFEDDGYKITNKDVAKILEFTALNAKLALLNSMKEKPKVVKQHGRQNRKSTDNSKQ